jgi:hypothetical protein
VSLQVLTAASMKMTAFWDTALCNVVDVDRRFTASIIIALMIRALHTTETSIYFDESTRLCIPEGC